MLSQGRGVRGTTLHNSAIGACGTTWCSAMPWDSCCAFLSTWIGSLPVHEGQRGQLQNGAPVE